MKTEPEPSLAVTETKNGEIECLRALAIFFVVLHHTPVLFNGAAIYPTWFANHFGFWTGVDLFFVISGFLITRSLTPLYEARKKERNLILKKYFIRRAFRLLPAAWLWILIPIFLSLFLEAGTHYPSYHTLINDAIAAFFQVANFYYAHCMEAGLTNKLCSQPQPIAPYWSLSLEEQFYFVLPALLMLASRRTIIFSAVLIIVIGFFWQRPIFTYGWFGRIDGLLWGVLLAHLKTGPNYSRLDFLKKPVVRTLIVSGLVVMLATLAGVGGAPLANLRPSWTPAIAFASVTGATLVFLATMDSGYLFGKNTTKILSWIGARSYSLYLAHMPMLMLASGLIDKAKIFTEFRALYAIAIAAASVLVATEATYRWIEKPAREFGKKFASRLN